MRTLPRAHHRSSLLGSVFREATRAAKLSTRLITFSGSKSMAQPNERSELIAAWRALAASTESAEGWRTIPLALSGPCRLRAGRRFPENEEALLVGFTGVRVPQAEHLPRGHGFLISKVDLGIEAKVWLALSRRVAGSLDLFTMMAFDIIGTLEAFSNASEEKVLQVFLARIRAWQDFMRRGTDTVLAPEAEIGLIGELVFLRSIMEVITQSATVIDSWLGPLNGIQDFVLGTGAVEVKTTIAASGFPATIECLDQ